jgi:hypothetical protein
LINQTKPKSIIMQETIIQNRSMCFIHQSQISHYCNNDSSIFEDADEDDVAITITSFYDKFNIGCMTNNFGNYSHKLGEPKNIKFDSTLITSEEKSWRDSNQSLDVTDNFRTMTNKDCKALDQEMAVNSKFLIRPVPTKKTNTSMTPVALSILAMCSQNLERSTIYSLDKINNDTFVRETDITDADILSGRGGKSNHHIGNKRFRHLVSEMKSMYRSKGTRTDKTAFSKGIIELVHSYGGRFLIQEGKDNDRVWRIMTTMEAQRKTSQALRETKILKWTQTLPDSMIKCI